MIRFLIIVFLLIKLAKSTTKCCPDQNIIENDTCLDGQEIKALPCPNKIIMAPSEEQNLVFKIDENDYLTITDQDESGFIIVQPEKYCMARDSENGTEVALLCYDEEEMSSHTPRIILTYLSLLCCFISVIFLFATLIIYIFIPELQDIEGKSIMIFVAANAVTFLLVFIGPIIVFLRPNTCDTISFALNVSFLCIFNWMTVLVFHLWRITIRLIFQKRINWFLIYVLYGFGIPLIMLITAAVSHFTQKMKLKTLEEQECWVEGSATIWVYFYSPTLLMLLLSIVLQLWVAKKLWIDVDRRDQSQSVLRLRKKCLMYAHMLLILILIDATELISFAFHSSEKAYVHYLQDVSDCRNYLLGGVIFFIFVVLRKKVTKALATRGLFCISFPEKWKDHIDEEQEEFENDERSFRQSPSGV